jgi:multiple sugar transport system permease protein
MKARWWVPFAFLAPALIGLVIFRFAPIVIAAVGSFHGTTLRGESFFVGLRNYSELFADPAFWSTISTTLIFNLIINPFQVVCALCLALLVERPTRFVDIFRASFLLPMTVSIALTSILWAIMLDPTLGPVNGFLRWAGLPAQRFFRSPDQALGTLIVVATWKGAGYWMVFLLAGLLSIPKGLYESAAIGTHRHRHDQAGRLDPRPRLQGAVGLHAIRADVAILGVRDVDKGSGQRLRASRQRYRCHHRDPLGQVCECLHELPP